jgi:hypothetical protein
MIIVDQIRVTKEIFGSEPKGREIVGRPGLRCLNDVENDVRELEMKKWWQKA